MAASGATPLQALSPFKYALSAFSVTILENEYFIGEEGENVSGDAVSPRRALQRENLSLRELNPK